MRKFYTGMMFVAACAMCLALLCVAAAGILLVMGSPMAGALMGGVLVFVCSAAPLTVVSLWLWALDGFDA